MPRNELDGLSDRIAALAPSYLERRIRDVSSLRRALAAKDWERIVGIGHDLRGTGASYGFPWLSELGGRLESAAHENRDQLHDLIRELQSRIEGARRALQTGQRSR